MTAVQDFIINTTIANKYKSRFYIWKHNKYCVCKGEYVLKLSSITPFQAKPKESNSHDSGVVHPHPLPKSEIPVLLLHLVLCDLAPIWGCHPSWPLAGQILEVFCPPPALKN